MNQQQVQAQVDAAVTQLRQQMSETFDKKIEEYTKQIAEMRMDQSASQLSSAQETQAAKADIIKANTTIADLKKRLDEIAVKSERDASDRQMAHGAKGVDYNHHFKELVPNVFSNKESDFLEWQEDSANWLSRLEDVTGPAILDHMLKMTHDLTDKEVADMCTEKKWDPEMLKKFSSAIYRYLVQKTTGTARRTVKNGVRFDGLNAWRRLGAEYNPFLVTGYQGHLRKALQVPRAKSVNDLSTRLHEFEEHVRKFTELSGKDFDPTIRTQRLYDLVPPEAEKQLLLERKDGKMQDYNELKTRIVTWAQLYNSVHAKVEANNLSTDHDGDEAMAALKKQIEDAQAAQAGAYGLSGRPSPEGEQESPESQWWRQQAVDVSAMYGKDSKGKGKSKGKGFQGNCWICGQFGHSSRNCKGKGKSKGKGKFGKGKGKGKFGNNKGKGNEAYALNDGWNGWTEYPTYQPEAGYGAGTYGLDQWWPSYAPDYGYGVAAMGLSIGGKRNHQEIENPDDEPTVVHGDEDLGEQRHANLYRAMVEAGYEPEHVQRMVNGLPDSDDEDGDPYNHGDDYLEYSEYDDYNYSDDECPPECECCHCEFEEESYAIESETPYVKQWPTPEHAKAPIKPRKPETSPSAAEVSLEGWQVPVKTVRDKRVRNRNESNSAIFQCLFSVG